MPRISKFSIVSDESKPLRPALSPEARENQMMALAVDLAEKQLRDGTASSQVITHFLKLASSRDRLEQELMEKQKELLVAKTEDIRSEKSREELYTKALRAMRSYSGAEPEPEPEGDGNYNER